MVVNIQCADCGTWQSPSKGTPERIPRDYPAYKLVNRFVDGRVNELVCASCARKHRRVRLSFDLSLPHSNYPNQQSNTHIQQHHLGPRSQLNILSSLSPDVRNLASDQPLIVHSLTNHMQHQNQEISIDSSHNVYGSNIRTLTPS